MDPITTVGVACNTLTFIEFAAALVRKVAEAERPTTSKGTQNESTERLWKLSGDLESKVDLMYEKLTSEEDEIKKVATACVKWARALRRSLNSFGRAPGEAVDPDRYLRTSVQALKSMWKEDGVKDAERFLWGARRDLYVQMTSPLLGDSSTIQRSIDILASKSSRLDEDVDETTQGLESLRDELLSTLRATFPASAALNRSDTTDLNRRVLQTLTAFHRKSEEAFNNRKWYILQSLWFDKITQRRRRVAEKHELTCDWIFESTHYGRPLRLLDWLENGDETYWITGNPGCGKSTIMKSILRDKRTSEALTTWGRKRHNSKVIVADFFFWGPGQYLEKSMEGLLRSLLHEVFRQCPSIIPSILPERWSDASSASPARPWSLEKLQDAIKSLGGHRDLGLSFCFFIDGLDEYVSAPSDIARTISDLSRTPCIKLCVSSRPWNEFEHAFGLQQHRYLTVHKLNQDDIRAYVNDMLCGHPPFNRRRQADRRHRAIIESVVTRSQGVFLWAFLVIRALKDSLPNETSFDAFQQRLDEFPNELVPFFDLMLDGILEQHREQSSKIILMFLRSLPLWGYLPLDLIRYLTEGRSDFLSMPMNEEPKESMTELSRTLTAKLKERCRGLLDVEDDSRREIYTTKDENPWIHRERITVLHRTMLDYLKSPRINDKIWARVSPDFSPEAEICQAVLADWKFVGCSWAFLTRDHPLGPSTRDSNIWVGKVLWEFCGIVESLGAYNTPETFPLLDEVQRMVSVRWSKPVSKTSQQDILMSIAIWKRFHGYVKSRITADQIRMLQVAREAPREADYDVPEYLTIFTGGNAMSLYLSVLARLRALEDVDVLMLKALLERGADVNSFYRTNHSNGGVITTCWQHLLEGIAIAGDGYFAESEQSEIEQQTNTEQLNHWAKIVVLCLEHGADFDTKVKIGAIAPTISQGQPDRMTGHQILRAVFAEMPDHLRSFGEAATRGACLVVEKKKSKKSLFGLHRLVKRIKT